MKIITLMAFFIFQLGYATDLMAQGDTGPNTDLNAKQQSIVSIASLTAQSDTERLKPALNAGLNAGLTINEIKEVIVHLYAYGGFPRSLRGLTTFMDVLEDREAQGIEDKMGDAAPPQFNDEKEYWMPLPPDGPQRHHRTVIRLLPLLLSSFCENTCSPTFLDGIFSATWNENS